MTEAERKLLLLVADALLVADTRQMLDRDFRLSLRAARHAMDEEARAARQSAPQGVQAPAGYHGGAGEAGRRQRRPQPRHGPCHMTDW